MIAAEYRGYSGFNKVGNPAAPKALLLHRATLGVVFMGLRRFLGTGMKHLHFIGTCLPFCYGILSSLTLSSLLEAWKDMLVIAAQDDFAEVLHQDPSLPLDYMRLLQRGLCWKPAHGEAAMPTLQDFADVLRREMSAWGNPPQLSA